MEKAKYPSLASWKAFFNYGLFLCFLVTACSTSNDGKSSKPVAFMPNDMQNIGLDNAVRSMPAGEALSRGIAAVTPPGAALQDVYYEFDSIDLRGDAEETLKRNADWSTIVSERRPSTSASAGSSPISSRASRSAAARASSPGSMRPPGTLSWPGWSRMC